jgi:D-sedoheptulose 7-phosphate isomerase
MKFPSDYKTELLKALDTVDLNLVNQAIELFNDARANGRQIFVCGNGGSASA